MTRSLRALDNVIALCWRSDRPRSKSRGTSPPPSTEKLDPVLCCNRAEVNHRAVGRTAARCHRGDHLINERIEHSAGRRNHQLAAGLRTKALDTVRRAAWSKKDVTSG